ncbi:MAG: hypothetical protein IKX24_09715 [Prevotella sp.]|nr:hypothetical protein [Prevotella sp.]
MNNFIVPPQKDRQMKVWLYAAIVAVVLTYARPFIFASDSSNVIMIGLRKLFYTEWVTSIFHIAYWILFVWIIGQLLMSFPSSMKWTKGSLWVVLAAYVVLILFGYIIPQPELGSPSLPTFTLVSSTISMIYTAAFLVFSFLLVRNQGGRLRTLGIAIAVWQITPFLISLIQLFYQPVSTVWYLAIIAVQMGLTIWAFVMMRRVYVPMWK